MRGVHGGACLAALHLVADLKGLIGTAIKARDPGNRYSVRGGVGHLRDVWSVRSAERTDRDGMRIFS